MFFLFLEYFTNICYSKVKMFGGKMMDNNEYIKALEERVARLEEIIKNIQLSSGGDVVIKDCQLQSLAIARANDVAISNFKADMVTTGLCKNTLISNATIENYKGEKNRKTIFKDCTTTEQK